MFWADLKIDFPYVKSGLELSRFNFDYVNAIPLMDFITDEFLMFLLKHGVSIKTRALFYTPPNLESPTHMDGPPGDYVKINFVMGGYPSRMNWFSAKNPTALPEFRQTSLNSSYINYDNPDDVEFIDSHEFYKPTILQVGVPHCITNGANPRYAISLGLRYKDSPITMDQAKNIFHKFLL